jgi:cell wall assembly regulator SMI1
MASIVAPHPAGPTDEAAIRAFEAYMGHPLPADYRQFLLQHNGGRPEPDALTLNIFGHDEEDVVMCFFPLRDLELGKVEVGELEELRTWPLHCAWDDLRHDLVHLYERSLDPALLPIGTDGSTNYFCLVLNGPQQGAVLFLENEMADTVELAPSFTAFLDSLRPRERTDYDDALG